MSKVYLFKRKMKHFYQRHTRGWDDSECWNLDFTFIKWLNSRIKVYKEQASKIIDFSQYEYKYKKRKYTHEEFMERLIILTEELIEANVEYTKEYDEKVEEMFDIFKMLYRSLWW